MASAQEIQHPHAAGLQSSKACLLELVRHHLQIKNPAQLSPALKTEMETPLEEFQDAMQSYWKFRPDAFTNVYDIQINTIFMSTRLQNYHSPRSPMDSLVHELTHFVQVHDLNGGSGDEDILEGEAIQVQTWFRDNLAGHIINGVYQGPCK